MKLLSKRYAINVKPGRTHLTIIYLYNTPLCSFKTKTFLALGKSYKVRVDANATCVLCWQAYWKRKAYHEDNK